MGPDVLRVWGCGLSREGGSQAEQGADRQARHAHQPQQGVLHGPRTPARVGSCVWGLPGSPVSCRPLTLTGTWLAALGVPARSPQEWAVPLARCCTPGPADIVSANHGCIAGCKLSVAVCRVSYGNAGGTLCELKGSACQARSAGALMPL